MTTSLRLRWVVLTRPTPPRTTQLPPPSIHWPSRPLTCPALVCSPHLYTLTVDVTVMTSGHGIEDCPPLCSRAPHTDQDPCCSSQIPFQGQFVGWIKLNDFEPNALSLLATPSPLNVILVLLLVLVLVLLLLLLFFVLLLSAPSLSYTHTRAHICLHLRAQVQAQVHTYMHTHTHSRTHMATPGSLLSNSSPIFGEHGPPSSTCASTILRAAVVVGKDI